MKLKEKISEETILAIAKKRINDMVAILSLFKPKYVKEVVEKVNKKLDTNLGYPLKSSELQVGIGEPGGWHWVESPYYIAELMVFVVIDHLDVNLTATLVETESFLTCEEIADLSFSTLMTYLLMCKTRNNEGEYWMALVCCSCNNLRALVASFNYDHMLILPEDAHWTQSILYAARLEECDIPY
ncbi:MAG: hypothetical protein ACXABC_01915 [Candidatus Thorarchaeota archaeon]